MKNQKSQKCRDTQKERIIIHLDYNQEKGVYEQDLCDYLKRSWQIGMSPYHRERLSKSASRERESNPRKGWTVSQDTRAKISDTLKSKHYVPWSKGLTKDSDPRLKHSSEIQKGKPSHRRGKKLTEEHCKNISTAKKGKASPLKGKTRPTEVGTKISESRKGHEVSLETRQKLSASKRGKFLPPEKLLIKTSKQYLTRKLHNTFNTSSSEELLYKTLLEENKSKTIYRNYKDERYPFYCDFYIVEDDLFIELNTHWTHGGRPYDPEDPECHSQLSLWKEKALTSQFYKNAIETWTIRDVRKRQVALKNNLNYRVIY